MSTYRRHRILPCRAGSDGVRSGSSQVRRGARRRLVSGCAGSLRAALIRFG